MSDAVVEPIVKAAQVQNAASVCEHLNAYLRSVNKLTEEKDYEMAFCYFQGESEVIVDPDGINPLEACLVILSGRTDAGNLVTKVQHVTTLELFCRRIPKRQHG